MPDFFLEAADPDAQLKESKELDRRVAASEGSTGSSGTNVDTAEVTGIMESVKGIMSEDYVKSVGAIFVFKLKGQLYPP